MSLTVKSLDARITQAWNFYICESNENFLNLAEHILKDSLPTYHRSLSCDAFLQVLQSYESHPPRDLIQLHACVLKLTHRYTDYEYMVSFLKHLIESNAIAPSFYLWQELGAHDFSQSEFVLAFRYFSRAYSLAKCDSHRLLTLSYQFLCCEKLGLSTKEFEIAIESLLENIDPLAVGLDKVNSLLSELELRKQFFNGAITPTSPTHFKSLTRAFSRTSYLFNYFTQVPILKSFTISSNDPSPSSRLDSKDTVNEYRTHTLNHHLSPTDLISPNISDWLDRFYLFVWRWLTTQDNDTLSQIMVLLKSSPALVKRDKLGTAEKRMLNNALAWMCLFDELSHFYFLSQFKEPATKALGLYPLLDLEHLFIAWMMAKIRNDDLLSNQYHKILKEQEEQLKSTHLGSLFSFAQGNETPLPPHLVLLGDTLRSLCNKNSSSEKRYYLNVTSGLFLKNNEPSTLAPPARRAIELLSISSTISARDFAAIVFGIKQYEPYRHDSKLRALLTKLSTLTKPDFHFGLREGYVYGNGNWAQLEIKKNVHPFLTPSYFSEWRHFILRPLEFIPNLSSFSLPKYFSREIPSEMTRTQIERLTNKSRATANRMISDWEKKGMVIRSGRSRNTRYKLSETLRDKLKNSDSI